MWLGKIYEILKIVNYFAWVNILDMFVCLDFVNEDFIIRLSYNRTLSNCVISRMYIVLITLIFDEKIH